MNNNYTYFSDFLKDRKFIQWQLTPNETLDEYWNAFIRKNPNLAGDIRRASAYLKTTGLNTSLLSDAENTRLLNKIQGTIKQNEKKSRIRRLIQYTATACASIALILGLTTYFLSEKPSTQQTGKEQIVGNLLNSEDIQLITKGNAVSFTNDVQVEVDEKGMAKIKQENAAEKTIGISKSSLNKLIVPYGKRSQLSLADGSKVWLNSGSVLEFPAQFSDKNREIYLTSGEMYIEVAPDKNKSFHVHTSNFNVRVYGTKFNVSNYSDSPQSVVLVEGSVGLRSSVGSEVKLLPNQQATYSGSGAFDTQRVNVDSYISWRNGYLTLDKMPITEVLKLIGRYYNISFNYSNDLHLQKRTCTGKIHLSENIDNVMTTIALLSSTKYDKNNNQIVITNENN